MHRRKFIKISFAVAALGAFVSACSRKKKIKGGMVGGAAGIGHMLRDGFAASPAATIHHAVVIIGAGVSGLAAARHLRMQGQNDFILLELEDFAGGNASGGKNAVSAFPWGAHYVPTPNNDLTEYIEFLREAGVVTGFDAAGLPLYNEYHLCFDPQERLYINGQWQEGLVPHYGVPTAEAAEIKKFMELVDALRYKKGSDGRDAFAIPVNASSTDAAFRALDNITMKEWMLGEGFNSAYLHWYVNYCTRDDYGTRHDACSAWAGIHYFASRKGRGANADHSDVLTWPEGNGFLVQHLEKHVRDRLKTGAMALSVKVGADGIDVHYYDVASKKMMSVRAAQCIMAVPQFIAARLLGDEQRRAKVKTHLQYAPWMVANLTVNELVERSGAPRSWDNVIYDSPSLGYVEATHELLQQDKKQRNLTYYLPLTDGDPATERTKAHERSYETWREMVLGELARVHPGLEDCVEELNVKLWGHAMAQPLPGWIHGPLRKELAASINNRVHFAHSDLAGVSIFEEAFYNGIAAARKITGEHGSI